MERQLEDIDHDRRRYLARLALTVAGAGLGVFGVTQAIDRASREFSGIERATEWINSPRLTASSLRGQGRAGRLLDLHVHQLAAHAAVRPRVGAEIPATARRRSACTHPSSRSNTTSTTFVVRCARWRSSIPSRSTTTTPSGAPSTTSTGRRSTSSTREGAFAITSSARATTSSRSAPFSSCWRKPARRRRRGAGAGRGQRRGSAGRLEQPAIAGELRRLRAHRRLRVAAAAAAAIGRTCMSVPARLALNQWALAGEWTMGKQATVLEQRRRPDRLPLSRARPASRHGCRGQARSGAVPRVDRRAATGRGARPRRRRRRQRHGGRTAPVSTHPPTAGRSSTGSSRSSSSIPASRRSRSRSADPGQRCIA